MTIAPLLELMKVLIELHCELQALATEKTPVLINNRIDQLNAIIQKENKLIRQVADLDRQRVQVIGEYLVSRGYNPDPRVTITDLIKIIFKADEKKALMEAQKQLLNLVTELRKLNEVNQKLIEHSLAFINYSLDLLVDDPLQDVIYRHPSGQAYNPSRNGQFNTKV